MKCAACALEDIGFTNVNILKNICLRSIKKIKVIYREKKKVEK